MVGTVTIQHSDTATAFDKPSIGAGVVKPTWWNKTHPSYYQDDRGGGTQRTLPNKINDNGAIASIVDFGGAGDNFSDNATPLTNALASGAAEISFPPGAYKFSQPQTILAHVNRLRGPGAVLQYTGADNADIFAINGHPGPLVIQDLAFQADPAVYINSDIFNILGATANLLIDNCWFKQCASFGITGAGSTSKDVTIQNCKFESLGRSAVYVFGFGSGWAFRNNKVYANRANTDLTVYFQKGTNLDIDGNLVDRGAQAGIYTSNISAGLRIRDNSVQNCLSDAIHVDATDGSAIGWIISNNQIDNPDLASGDLGICVFANGAANGLNKDGLIVGNNIRKVGRPGIYLVTDPVAGNVIRNIGVLGNKITDCNQNSDPNIGGIMLDGQAGSTLKSTRIMGNEISSSDGKMQWGILEIASTSDYTRAYDNTIIGAATSPGFILTGAHSTASDNRFLAA